MQKQQSLTRTIGSCPSDLCAEFMMLMREEGFEMERGTCLIVAGCPCWRIVWRRLPCQKCDETEVDRLRGMLDMFKLLKGF